MPKITLKEVQEKYAKLLSEARAYATAVRNPKVRRHCITIGAVVLWVLFVLAMPGHAQTCQESPSNPRENAALASFRIKIQNQYVQGVTLSGCDGHDYILVMLYPNPPREVLKRIPKKFHHIPVKVKVWPEHPRID